MKLLTQQVDRNCDIMLIGDTHEGSALVHRSALEKALTWVMRKKNRYYVHMGDAIEAITTDDKRYDVGSNDQPIPMLQADAVVEQYRKSASRCLVWLLGNHEYTLHRVGDFAAYIAGKLGVPYGTWTCKLALDDKDGNRIAKFFLCHGAVRGTFRSNAKDYEQQQANMKAALKRSMIHKACDCILMACGHTHKLMVVEPAQRLILSDDGTEINKHYLGAGDGGSDYIEPDRRWYVNTGCFLKLYGDGIVGYGERAGYDPVETGYAIARIRDGRLDSVSRVVV